ncbi:MAG: hypothetical protein JNK05_30705 [Myxococcales bacterium]|nr:hypothetical protein [Myxococcales bacterium]
MFSIIVQIDRAIGASMPADLVTAAREMGFDLAPQFPGVDDETLGSFVIATTSRATDLESASSRFRAVDSVISAYPAPSPMMP